MYSVIVSHQNAGGGARAGVWSATAGPGATSMTAQGDVHEDRAEHECRRGIEGLHRGDQRL